MRPGFRIGLATTLVAGLGACSSTQHNSDAPSDDLPVQSETSNLTAEVDSSSVNAGDSSGSVSDESGDAQMDQQASRPRRRRHHTADYSGAAMPVVAAAPFQADGF